MVITAMLEGVGYHLSPLTRSLSLLKSVCGNRAFLLMDLTGHSVLLFLPFPLQPSLPVLYTLSSQATHEAVHLLCRMLVFDPVSRTENHL